MMCVDIDVCVYNGCVEVDVRGVCEWNVPVCPLMDRTKVKTKHKEKNMSEKHIFTDNTHSQNRHTNPLGHHTFSFFLPRSFGREDW